MKFSVLIVTYHSDLDKILLTLRSVIKQRFDDFEVIISDDGSKENHFAEIEAFFKANCFVNYKLIANKTNQGTVRNLISGLKLAEGKYVRDFGPGDMFYAENTMQKLYEFMEKETYEGCFGLMRGYCLDEQGKIKKKDFCHPFDIEAYRKKDNDKKILKDLVLYSDHVSGAATCYRREYYLEYLEKIKDYVIYEEDIFQVLAALEGRRLRLFDDYMVWYEVGEGASTQKHSKFEEALRQDTERFYQMLYRRHGGNPYIQKRKKLEPFYKIKNLYARTLLRLLVNPDAIRYLVSSMLQKKRKAHMPVKEGEGFLEEKEFLES